MNKTLLYRLFGVGAIPEAVRPALEQEGILLVDEGIGVAVAYRDFRAPGKRFHRKRTWYSGAVVLTTVRIAGYVYGSPVMDLPRDDARMQQITWSVDDKGRLNAQWDVSLFHDDWSGTMGCRFSTALAGQFLQALTADGPTGAGG